MPRHSLSTLDTNTVQELAASPYVAPFICGAAAGDAPLAPGGTWRGVMEVDTDICGDDAVFSTVSMLSELPVVGCTAVW